MRVSQSARPGQDLVTVRDYYEDFDPEERLRIWEESKGIALISRERLEENLWTAPRPEIQGYYHFHMQAWGHVQCGEFNSIPQHAVCPAGAVQFVRPDEKVHAAGVEKKNSFDSL